MISAAPWTDKNARPCAGRALLASVVMHSPVGHTVSEGSMNFTSIVVFDANLSNARCSASWPGSHSPHINHRGL
jgi:hypothetical protein